MHRLTQSIALLLLISLQSFCCFAREIAHYSVGVNSRLCGSTGYSYGDKPSNFSSVAPTNTPSTIENMTLTPTLSTWSPSYSTNSVDFLVAAFFLIAAAWLTLAFVYSVLVLIILRLRARGELDIYDEDFGRIYLIGRRCFIPLACILRRYVVTLNQNFDAEQVRHMTREERRSAIEIIFSAGGQTALRNETLSRDTNATQISEVGDSENMVMGGPQQENDTFGPVSATPTTHMNVYNDSRDEPLCSICLMEYEFDSVIFTSITCSHQYHQGCICDWLERQANTDCPCCRNPLVTDDEVWEMVQRVRRERRKQRRHHQGRNSIVDLLCFWSRKSRESERESQEDRTGIASIEAISVHSTEERDDTQTRQQNSDIQIDDIETGHSIISVPAEQIDTATIGSEISSSHRPLELICVTKDESELPLELTPT